MNDIIVKDDIKIEDLIYEIRGKQVMLDSDFAKLYNCKNGTKEINQAVKRNMDRFPEDFYFQLTKYEYDNLKSQIVTSSNNNHGGNRKLPYVFTEQGVAMLSSTLKTITASITSVNIMRAFVAMRKYINTNLIEQKYINNLVFEHDKDIKLLKEIFNKLSTKEKVNHIFFDGEIYDAYSVLIKILSKAKKEIIIIDNYAGKELFDITRNIKINIKIYTKNIDSIAKKKYEEEYNNLTIINTAIFHDRFIILDNNTLYNLGSSLKDIGKKCTSINKIDDTNIIKNLLDRINNINNNWHFIKALI